MHKSLYLLGIVALSTTAATYSPYFGGREEFDNLDARYSSSADVRAREAEDYLMRREEELAEMLQRRVQKAIQSDRTPSPPPATGSPPPKCTVKVTEHRLVVVTIHSDQQEHGTEYWANKFQKNFYVRPSLEVENARTFNIPLAYDEQLTFSPPGRLDRHPLLPEVLRRWCDQYSDKLVGNQEEIVKNMPIAEHLLGVEEGSIKNALDAAYKRAAQRSRQLQWD